MHGLGTIINTVAIIVGGFLGVFFGKMIKERFRDMLGKSCGIAVIFIGMAGTLEEMLSTTTDGEVVSSGAILIVGCLVVGSLVGELCNIEGGLEKLGDWLKRKTRSNNDGNFVDGFVSASLTVCIGAMAIMGSIQDGIYGDFSILLTKSILDFIIVMVMAGSLGKGCIFSAIPVAIFQGSITALSLFIKPIIMPAIPNLSMIGSILIFCVGINLVFGKRIKVANMLPAVLFAIIAAFLPWQL